MSVIVIGRLTVDPANLERLWADRRSDFEAIADVARKSGALHHRWAFGEGEVMIVDEWPDAGSFQRFFESQTKIPELMAEGGVQGPPTFEIFEAQATPDEF